MNEKPTPEISPLYTQRKFSMTKDEIEKIDDPQVLAKKIEKIVEANEVIDSVGPNTIEEKKIQKEAIDEEIAGFELELETLKSMEERFVTQTDARLKEILSQELFRTKKSVYDAINKYQENLRGNGDEEIRKQKERINLVKNEIREIGNPDKLYKIAA